MTLPPGFVVRLNRHTRVVDAGRALLGGTPTRLVRLTPAARPLLEGREVRVRSGASAALADRLLELGMADPIVAELSPPDDAGVTVVVPTLGRADHVERLLASVPAGLAVIVVDDGSPDAAPVARVAVAAGAELVRLEVNVGPGAARNAGLARVRTPFVLFCDSDIVLDPDTLDVLLRHMSDPRVGMAVPRIAGLETPGSGSWLGRYEEARSSLDLGKHPASVRPRSPVSWASTACVLARVSALGNGFDPRMRVGEDVDLGWRLVEQGWRIRYEPAVRARHEHRTRLVDWSTRKFVYGTGAQPLAVRHPRAIAPAVMAPWSVAFVAALLAQRRWSVSVAGAVAAVTAVRISRKLEGVRHPLVWASWLTANGAVAALAQGMALLLRHWWPLAALGCLVSRRIRRAVLVAAIGDVALEWRRNAARSDPLRFGVARRLDDLAYGAGVWWSAVRARSTAPLRPDLRGSASLDPVGRTPPFTGPGGAECDRCAPRRPECARSGAAGG